MAMIPSSEKLLRANDAYIKLRTLTPDIRQRNVGLISFTPDIILQALMIPDVIRIHGHEGIHYDFNCDRFRIKVKHESFPAHKDGEEIREVQGLVTISQCKECNRPNIKYDLDKLFTKY